MEKASWKCFIRVVDQSWPPPHQEVRCCPCSSLFTFTDPKVRFFPVFCFKKRLFLVVSKWWKVFFFFFWRCIFRKVKKCWGKKVFNFVLLISLFNLISEGLKKHKTCDLIGTPVSRFVSIMGTDQKQSPWYGIEYLVKVVSLYVWPSTVYLLVSLQRILTDFVREISKCGQPPVWLVIIWPKK